jgi:hypothetical protein
MKAEASPFSQTTQKADYARQWAPALSLVRRANVSQVNGSGPIKVLAKTRGDAETAV